MDLACLYIGLNTGLQPVLGSLQSPTFKPAHVIYPAKNALFREDNGVGKLHFTKSKWLSLIKLLPVVNCCILYNKDADMNKVLEKCPACSENLKVSVFGGVNELLAESRVALINEYHEHKVSGRCNRCGNELYRQVVATLSDERKKLVDEIQKNIHVIPITSIHSPQKWDYSVVTLITAQSTTGTGVFSEITSTFTDLFGTQSKAYNNKLKIGEELCKNVLRQQALDLGAHAIVAVDIDYAEVGGERGMLMVCMSGTAIVLHNIEILGRDTMEKFSQIVNAHVRLKHLAQYEFA